MPEPIRIATLTRFGFPMVIDSMGLETGLIIGAGKGDYAFNWLSTTKCKMLYLQDIYRGYREPGQYDLELKCRPFKNRMRLFTEKPHAMIGLLASENITLDFIYLNCSVEFVEHLSQFCNSPTLISGETIIGAQKRQRDMTGNAMQMADKHSVPLYLTSEPRAIWWYIVA